MRSGEARLAQLTGPTRSASVARYAVGRMPDPTKNSSGVLSVRGMDARLLQRAKMLAHQIGHTMREFVSEALKREVERREAGR
jgi:hypothetical protein